MKDTVFLICDRHGVTKLRKHHYNTSAGQIAVRVVVDVDDDLFLPPTIRAKITVTGERKSEDINIEQRVQDALAASGIKADVVLTEAIEEAEDEPHQD